MSYYPLNIARRAMQRARRAFRNGVWDQTVTCCDIASSHRADRWDVHLLKARALMNLHRFRDAGEAAMLAGRLAPTRTLPWRTLATPCFHLGEIEKGLQTVDRELGLEVSDEALLCALA